MPATEVELLECRQFFSCKTQFLIGNRRFTAIRSANGLGFGLNGAGSARDHGFRMECE